MAEDGHSFQAVKGSSKFTFVATMLVFDPAYTTIQGLKQSLQPFVSSVHAIGTQEKTLGLHVRPAKEMRLISPCRLTVHNFCST